MSKVNNSDVGLLFLVLMSAAHFLCDGFAYRDGRESRERIELKLQQIEEAQQACGLGREDI